MLAVEFVRHETYITNNDEGRKIADDLRNKLYSKNKSFKELQRENVIYFRWLEAKPLLNEPLNQ